MRISCEITSFSGGMGEGGRELSSPTEYKKGPQETDFQFIAREGDDKNITVPYGTYPQRMCRSFQSG